jgi:hypothetical protein
MEALCPFKIFFGRKLILDGSLVPAHRSNSISVPEKVAIQPKDAGADQGISLNVMKPHPGSPNR